MDKITSSILESINILIDHKLSQLQFDKTIICTIVKCTNIDKGEYQVSYMDSKFLAYSLNKNINYNTNDIVYVKIPENNFNAKKIIEGLY